MLLKLPRGKELQKNKRLIIEFYGTINCGKKILAQAFAKKIRASYYECPSLSITGMDYQFMTILKDNPNKLLENYDKWIAMYKSFLFNYHDQIQKESEYNIVVTTNYLKSVEFYSKLGCNRHNTGVRTNPIISVYCHSDVPFYSEIDIYKGCTEEMENLVRSIEPIPGDMKFKTNPRTLQMEHDSVINSLYEKLRVKAKLKNEDYFSTRAGVLKSIQVYKPGDEEIV
jgi:hypothetical protein